MMIYYILLLVQKYKICICQWDKFTFCNFLSCINKFLKQLMFLNFWISFLSHNFLYLLKVFVGIQNKTKTKQIIIIFAVYHLESYPNIHRKRRTAFTSYVLVFIVYHWASLTCPNLNKQLINFSAYSWTWVTHILAEWIIKHIFNLKEQF